MSICIVRSTTMEPIFGYLKDFLEKCSAFVFAACSDLAFSHSAHCTWHTVNGENRRNVGIHRLIDLCENNQTTDVAMLYTKLWKYRFLHPRTPTLLLVVEWISLFDYRRSPIRTSQSEKINFRFISQSSHLRSVISLKSMGTILALPESENVLKIFSIRFVACFLSKSI